jgi:hypothetical protein
VHDRIGWGEVFGPLELLDVMAGAKTRLDDVAPDEPVGTRYCDEHLSRARRSF